MDDSLKPCPFCGMETDITDSDVIHPSGIGWEEMDGGGRSYRSFREVPRKQWCWNITCLITAGGCGVTMSGDTMQECINNWNKRTNE